MKKMLWRALRGSFYGVLSAVLAKYVSPWLDPVATVALGTAIMSALDKKFGVGAWVKP